MIRIRGQSVQEERSRPPWTVILDLNPSRRRRAVGFALEVVQDSIRTVGLADPRHPQDHSDRIDIP